MKQNSVVTRSVTWILAPLCLVALAGCEAGVGDIVAGSLQLAFGIVDVAS